jgi:hypothetical protein
MLWRKSRICDCRLEARLVPPSTSPAQVPGLNELRGRIEQTRLLLTGPDSEVLIGELRGHAAARRAI